MANVSRTAASLWVMLLTLPMVAPSAFAHDSGRMALGDGKISKVPQMGHVLACESRFPGGGGAHRTGAWIDGKTWTRSGKPTVEGSVRWPNAAISISVEGSERVIRANGLPRHVTGEFPIKPGTTAYAYDRNPNSIRAGDVLLRLPAEPRQATQPACVPMGMIGFTIAGVAIFNAFDLGGRDAPAYEIQDKCNGHPERTGVYHYHDWSPCMVAADHPPNRPVGWMLDGFPILGPKDENGRAVTNAELDACHGRVGDVEIDGRLVQTYHYRFTMEFPYTIGCFKGVPIRAAQAAPGTDQRGRILDMAAQTLGISSSTLRDAVGPPPPDFARAARRLNRPEEDIRKAFEAARSAVNAGR